MSGLMTFNFYQINVHDGLLFRSLLVDLNLDVLMARKYEYEPKALLFFEWF